MDEQLWGEMLDVLKDISTFLSKEADTEMEKTSTDAEDFKRPKTGESQAKEDPIKGGGDPSGKPGEDVIKAENDEDKEDKEEEKDEKEDEKKDTEKSDDVDELKSLLKDIKSALSADSSDVAKSVADTIKKSVKEEVKDAMPGMLRKMGFAVSRPDIRKLGVDEVLKSEEDELDVNIKKAEDLVNDLSKKSWRELASLRQSSGDFNPFQRS